MSGEVDDSERMALLWLHLPAESRTARIQSPELEWGVDSYLLWQIEYQLRSLSWALTYDKKHPSKAPDPLQTPAQLRDAHRRRDKALSEKDEIARLLGLEVD